MSHGDLDQLEVDDDDASHDDASHRDWHHHRLKVGLSHSESRPSRSGRGASA